MSDRLMRVNAYTTLDYVEATATGHEFEFDSVAVANATTDREEPDCVRFQVELDNATDQHFPKHMTELELTPDQARELASELEKYADRVEDAAE
ncbi:DUF6360 family protein [Natrialba sp. PRR66]|uniref:DUF6360 family protein n=1 Tax=Natrialba sp. PRR66 TaxID=3098146 RepID=UPI002B1DFE1E|nr:DUF6360 family protein [Natrialba sp. PRR66]